MAGFKGTDKMLSAGDAALAKRIVEGMERALAEDRLIRTAQMPEQFTVTRDGVERVAR